MRSLLSVCLLLLLAGQAPACPGCWKGGSPWQPAQGQEGMQLESLRKHFAKSRFDQPVQLEKPTGEERLKAETTSPSRPAPPPTELPGSRPVRATGADQHPPR